MSTEPTLDDSIDSAATTVGSVWPIHSFVTANPLSGFEDQPFEAAVAEATDLLGGRGYPSAETFRTALADGRIDAAILRSELADRGFEADPETLLDRLDEAERDDSDAGGSTDDPESDAERVDTILTKWLSAFLDEGRAHWSMPNREEGFYTAFRALADHDGELPDSGVVADLPASPTAAIEAVVESYPASQWEPIFEEQLAALPGWTGFIKQRADDDSEWQSEYPITLEGYLAVRLSLLDGFGVDLDPETDAERAAPDPADEIAAAFLHAWEATYREALVETVARESERVTDSDGVADGETAGRPDAQLTFCIDTRSEVIRRHIEATGDYETHGYAGFFGVPIEYNGYESEVSVDACPPILDPQHRITELPTDDETQATHDRLSGVRAAAHEVIETLQANASSAYGYVESTGSGYGLALAARTLVPGRVHDLVDSLDDAEPDTHEFCEPMVHHQHTYVGDLPVGLTTDEKVEYAATAFDLMGFETFGRVVAFVGHASETENNPYDSSLDCGACAGNPGGPNARVLAAICNDDAVKEALREQGHEVPDDTVFVAGEHNTTTDEIELFADDVPASHADDIDQLRADLATAREHAAAERAEAMGAEAADAKAETERRAADWAETRPELGLAGNASFVIGPRDLTADVNLDGRAFLHSYNHTTDPEGDALEAILAGPMVVTQWINTQYYFSTVDSGVYGSGSKITHNPVGNIGVYQGNGGDLLTGLPTQSVAAGPDDPYHQPLRLSTVVHAPVDRVEEILADHDELTTLLDNGWLSLTVVDPTREHQAFHYDGELSWTGESDREPAAAAEPAAATTPADD